MDFEPSDRAVELRERLRAFITERIVPHEAELIAAIDEDLQARLPPVVRAVAIYSRSDGIVSWEACLDPSAEHVEVESSHGGMSVNTQVYRVLARILDQEGDRWTG